MNGRPPAEMCGGGCGALPTTAAGVAALLPFVFCLSTVIAAPGGGHSINSVRERGTGNSGTEPLGGVVVLALKISCCGKKPRCSRAN